MNPPDPAAGDCYEEAARRFRSAADQLDRAARAVRTAGQGRAWEQAMTGVGEQLDGALDYLGRHFAEPAGAA